MGIKEESFVCITRKDINIRLPSGALDGLLKPFPHWILFGLLQDTSLIQMWNSVIFVEFIVILLVISTWGLSQIHFSYLESIISPASKLHITVLIIKWEPGDVYLAGWLEDARGYVGAAAPVCHHHIGGEGPVKLLVSAANITMTSQWW